MVASRAAFEHAQMKCDLLRFSGVASLNAVFRHEAEKRANIVSKNERDKFLRIKHIFGIKRWRLRQLKKGMRLCKECEAEVH